MRGPSLCGEGTLARMASSSDTALQTFSLTNDIKDIPPQDEIYKFDVEANKRLIREQPWANE